jgi:hypothetical protein
MTERKAEDPAVRVLDEFPDLLRQAAPEPRYSQVDVALVEERLAQFDEVVEAAYRATEELPEPARMRKARRRDLLHFRKDLSNTIRFCIKCGLPLEMELDRLDQVEQRILAYFPDAEPRTVQH